MPIGRPVRAAVALAALLAPALAAQAPRGPEPGRYMQPPKNIVDVFDAEPLPQAIVRHVPDPVRASVHGAEGTWRHGALRDAAVRSARLRCARNAAARAVGAAELV